MASSVILKTIFSSFLLPPGLFILLLMLAFFLRQQAPKWSPRLFWSTLAAMYLLSTPLVGNQISQLVESQIQNKANPGINANAIVVLGGGSRFGAKDMLEGQTINNVTLARVRYAAKVHKFNHLPILVSGGAPQGGIPEAQLMRQSLQKDFGVATTWLESASNDTDDNAKESAKLLLPQYAEIILITSAEHMQRASRSFEQAGFIVHAAPTDFHNHEPFSVMSFFPNAKVLASSSSASRELLGQIWYRILGH